MAVSPDRTCKMCGKSFRSPIDFRRHQDRKTPCAPILETNDLQPPQAPQAPQAPQKEDGQKQCRFCKRVFSCYTSMRRHVRTSCKIAPNPKNGDVGMQKLYEHTLQRQIDRLEAQNAEMKSQNAEILTLLRQQRAGGTNTQQAGEIALQGDHAQVDNSKKIVVNVFGKEGLDHVTLEKIKTILDECLQRPALPTAVDEAVLRTAMLVYSDPSRPENLTAYLPNKKTNDALVHTEAGWEVRPTTLVLPPMALKSIDTLFGKQPHDDEYAPLLKELQQNEARFAAGEALRPILVRNKDLLARALATLPVAGREIEASAA